MKILIADDEAVTRGMLEHTLSSAGHEVIAVEDGQRALAILEETDIQMVISDWGMPNMNGIDLCRAVRAGGFDRYIYIIMLTSHDRPQDILEGLNAGADDFVTKPYNPPEVICRIRGGLRQMALETAEATITEMAELNSQLGGEVMARQKAERELREINAELMGKNVEMEEFVYTVSHDLKSPIVTQIGFIGCIREDLAEGDEEQVLDSVARLERATLRMQRCLDDLLQISRIGRVKYEYEELDIAAMVREIWEDLSGVYRDSTAVLEIEGDLPTISADRLRVAEVFENLISNAIKYGCKNGAGVISVGARIGAEGVCYFVRDRGPGIAAEYHTKIFGLFQRLDAGKKEGTGIGLTIVSRVMEQHKGRAWVESAESEGATFRIAFPLSCLSSREVAAYLNEK